jgi:hypothetical protein
MKVIETYNLPANQLLKLGKTIIFSDDDSWKIWVNPINTDDVKIVSIYSNVKLNLKIVQYNGLKVSFHKLIRDESLFIIKGDQASILINLFYGLKQFRTLDMKIMYYINFILNVCKVTDYVIYEFDKHFYQIKIDGFSDYIIVDENENEFEAYVKDIAISFQSSHIKNNEGYVNRMLKHLKKLIEEIYNNEEIYDSVKMIYYNWKIEKEEGD